MERKYRLLDLFCGAGGAAMGYHRAGFEVVGVDINPQPHYPFTFIQADALEYAAEHGAEYDAIHASPPCQKFTTLQNVNRFLGHHVDHPDLIGVTRRALIKAGKPFVIENVPGSPLNTVIILCGATLGLKELARHRLFETNIMMFGTKCTHRQSERILGVYGSKPDGRPVMRCKEYRVTYAPRGLAEGANAMGIDWMEWDELKLAIPPAYTEYIGKQLMQYLERG